MKDDGKKEIGHTYHGANEEAPAVVVLCACLGLALPLAAPTHARELNVPRLLRLLVLLLLLLTLLLCSCCNAWHVVSGTNESRRKKEAQACLMPSR